MPGDIAILARRRRSRIAPSPLFRYRRLTTSELPLLNNLYNAYYSSNRPLEEAVWLYANNPNGPAVIHAAFDENGALAGMRPSIPFAVWWDGRERMAYELCDALVAPQYQRRGIFSRLLKTTCDWAQQQGHVLYSLPNEKSLAAYRHISALQVIGDSRTVARPLALVAYAARRLNLGPESQSGAAWQAQLSTTLSDGKVSLRPVERFECDFHDVERALQDRGLRFTLRRRASLQWRYFESPVRRYHVALVEEEAAVRGYLVIRLMSGVAQIIDFFVYPEATLARSAFVLAARWAKVMGACGIHFIGAGQFLFHDAARQSGYWLRRASRRFVVNRLDATDPSVADVYFVMGDFDFL